MIYLLIFFREKQAFNPKTNDSNVQLPEVPNPKIQEFVEKEAKTLLRLLALVNKGELSQGIKKITNPRTKIIEGAGMISMKTLEEYNQKLKRQQNGDNDSVSYLKKNQGNIFDSSALLANPEKNQDSFDKLSLSSFSSSFLKSADLNNKIANGLMSASKRNEYLFGSKNNKFTQNANLIMNSNMDFKPPLGPNEFSRSYDGGELGRKFADISSISGAPNRFNTGKPEPMGSASNLSIFVGTGKTLLKNIDDEYERLLLKKL